MPIASAKHEAIYQEINDVLRKHGDSLSAEEILAILSNMVGKVIAMQDQRRYTQAQILRIVQRNIEIGNGQVIDSLRRTEGSA